MFRQLGLVDAAPEHRDSTEDPAPRGGELLIHRHRGNTAPRAILASASLEYAHTCGATGPGSIALTRLRTDPLGPGRLMLTDHRALPTALSWAANGPLANHVALSESRLDGELLSFAAPPPVPWPAGCSLPTTASRTGPALRTDDASPACHW